VFAITDHQEIVQIVILLLLLLVDYVTGEFKESLECLLHKCKWKNYPVLRRLQASWSTCQLLLQEAV